MQTDKNIININLHSVVLLVGPSNCGKSFFAQNHLIPKLNKLSVANKPLNIQYLSSDQIRREMLGGNLDKYDRRMIYASDNAFDILLNKLKNVTSWPINSEVVIVDTLGLNKEFRDRVAAICEQNNYKLQALVFDYKNRDDYFKYIENISKKDIRRMISRHIYRLRNEALQEVTKRSFGKAYRLRTNEFNDYRIELNDYNDYTKHFLEQNKSYVIIGDIHGCKEELLKIIEKNGFEIDSNEIIKEQSKKEIILIGDLIDKGYDTKGVIEFVYKNLGTLKIVKGNHENFVYKYLKGVIKETTISVEFQKEFFDTVKILQSDETLYSKFLAICENSIEFYSHPDFIATHAPCKKKYLAKIDKESLKKQRTIRYQRLEDFENKYQFGEALEKELEFIKTESLSNHPFHIFGHVAFKDTLKVSNKIGIDTGCVHANRLTSVIIEDGWIRYKSISSTQNQLLKKSELPKPIFQKAHEVQYKEVDPKYLERLHYIIQNKINYISGTISPADKSKDHSELESLKEGLDYYKKHGVAKVVLQPKYMGSRANIYLFEDIEKSYAVSRNGHLIKTINLSEIYLGLYNKLKQKFSDRDIELIIIDGELMPWYALGKELIEEQYKVIESAIRQEVDLLKNTGFEKGLFELFEVQYKQDSYEESTRNKSKKEVIELFGHRKYRTYKDLKNIIKKHIPLTEQLKLLENYESQVANYGKEEPLHFNPFNILKIVYKSGKEELPTESIQEIFKMVSNDEINLINLDDTNAYNLAQNYFDKMTLEKNMEGIMIKPEFVKSHNLAPAIKVRNKNYLTIIYGYDYLNPNRYSKLIEKKNIKEKLKTSINEYKIGQRMLGVKYNEINQENEEFKKLVLRMISEEEKEKQIDPRL